MTNRRDALKLMSLTGMGLFTQAICGAREQSPDSAVAEKEQNTGTMSKTAELRKRAIPSSGEQLAIVGLGTWQTFDVGSSQEDRAPLKEVLQLMKKYGGQVVDSSPMYGSSEKVVGDLTAELGIPDDFFYATKVWTTGKQAGIDQMNDSLRKMRRQTMDLMQIHNLQDWQTHLKTIREWKAQGKIRYIGITHYTDGAHDRLEQLIKTEKDIDFVQFNYSIRNRHAEKSLLPAARDQGVAVLINQPYESGSLFRIAKGKEIPEWAKAYDISSWGQFFLKFILSHPAVTCVIPGTSKPNHLEDNMQAAYGELPDEAAREKMAAFVEGL